ncbi:MAG: DEAD/DEAH box helicase [Bdellovibrionales bacterium]|nr:DEAD/DEAH box helicase [Bdellovibrionales bacterium]
MSSEELAAILSRELARPNRLTNQQAALYSHSVRLAWRTEGLQAWNETKSSSQLEDAVRLIEAAEALSSENETLEKESYRRAGDLFEWLSNSNHIDDSVPLGLLAAASFCLADCPAMAMGILFRPSIKEDAPIFAAFLRADFDEVLELSLDFWANNLGLCGAPRTEVAIPSADQESAHRYMVTELVRTLGLLSAALKENNQHRFEIAKAKLHSLAKLCLQQNSSYTWLLLKLTYKVVELFEQNSAWQLLLPIRNDLTDTGKQFADMYCRSLFQRGQGLLWPSQKAGISKLADQVSFAMCTPTGSGKTTVAEIALLQSSYSPVEQSDWGESGLAALSIYIVPSRALAIEVESRLAGSIGRSRSGISVVGLYGGSDLSLSDVWLELQKPTVLVCTVEKAEALFRYIGGLLITRLSLLIVDEAHQVNLSNQEMPDDLATSENRSARLESFVARIRLQKPECRLVALSAVAGGAENIIAQWADLTAEGAAVGAKYRSTRQLIGALECNSNGKARITLEVLNGGRLRLTGSESEVFIPISFPPMPRVTGALRTELTIFVECHVLWLALHLAVADKKVLISVTQKIDSVLSHYCKLFESQRHWRSDSPDFFQRPRRGPKKVIFERCLKACSDYCGESSFEFRLLSRGIAVHHGQLPVKVRKLMTEVIRMGVTPIVVATSTLTEGVNLPFDVILLPKIKRSRENDDGRFSWPTIATSEFMNLAGRAGRPGTNAEGMTLVALPMDITSSSSSRAARKQRRQIRDHADAFGSLVLDITRARPENNIGSPIAKLLELIFKLWNEVSGSNDQSQFTSWLETVRPAEPNENEIEDEAREAVDTLDQIILSAIEEVESLRQTELSPNEIEATIRDLWKHTYARFASNASAALEEIFVSRGKILKTDIYPDRDERTKIYRTGLSPKNARSFIAQLPAISAQLVSATDYSSWDTDERLNFFIELIEIISEHSFFVIPDNRLEEWKSIFAWWMRATNLTPDPSLLNGWLKFSSQMFEYKMGAAVGSALTLAWNESHSDSFEPVDLDRWVEQTGLPWAAFWFKELLVWGTLEPLTAYLLATGKIESRGESAPFLQKYTDWFSEQFYADSELFNPKMFNQWSKIEFEISVEDRVSRTRSLAVELKRNFPRSEIAYSVIPRIADGKILWFDPAGFLLAESALNEEWQIYTHYHNRFSLNPSLKIVERKPITSIDRSASS